MMRNNANLSECVTIRNLRTLVTNSASPLPTTIHMAAKGAGTTEEVGPPISGAREQMANSEFATSVPPFRVRTGDRLRR